MMKKLLIVCFALATMVLATGCVYVPVSGQWDYGVRRVPIFGARSIGQDFFVSDRNLSRVDIFFYKSKALRGVRKEVQRKRIISTDLKGKNVIMRLLSLPDRRELVSFKLPARKIREDKMYTFIFKPIADSKQKRFFVELTAPDLTDDLSVAVRLTSVDRYKEGQVYINGQPDVDSDLGFKTFIDMNSRQLLHSVGARLAADPVFMAVWALLVAIVSAIAIVIWRQASKEAKEIRTAD